MEELGGVLVDRFDVFASGLWLTLQICVLAGVGAVVLGAVVAVLRISPVGPLRAVGTAYVTLFRNVPLTVIMLLRRVWTPAARIERRLLRIPLLDTVFSRLAIDLPYFRFFLIALACYTAAFVCEALRAGVNAVAARAGRGGAEPGDDVRAEPAPRGRATGLAARGRSARVA